MHDKYGLNMLEFEGNVSRDCVTPKALSIGGGVEDMEEDEELEGDPFIHTVVKWIVRFFVIGFLIWLGITIFLQFLPF